MQRTKRSPIPASGRNGHRSWTGLVRRRVAGAAICGYWRRRITAGGMVCLFRPVAGAAGGNWFRQRFHFWREADPGIAMDQNTVFCRRHWHRRTGRRPDRADLFSARRRTARRGSFCPPVGGIHLRRGRAAKLSRTILRVQKSHRARSLKNLRRHHGWHHHGSIGAGGAPFRSRQRDGAGFELAGT